MSTRKYNIQVTIAHSRHFNKQAVIDVLNFNMGLDYVAKLSTTITSYFSQQVDMQDRDHAHMSYAQRVADLVWQINKSYCYISISFADTNDAYHTAGITFTEPMYNAYVEKGFPSLAHADAVTTIADMTIEDLIDESYSTAKEKGWWDNERPVGDIFMNIVAEMSEAWEEYRNNQDYNHIYYVDNKPEGIPVELADVFIRIADFCGKYNIPLERAIKEKMAFNKTRSYRHGEKRA